MAASVGQSDDSEYWLCNPTQSTAFKYVMAPEPYMAGLSYIMCYFFKNTTSIESTVKYF